MAYSWDENKRLVTIAERDLDFGSAFLFFDGRPVIHQETFRNGEERWKSTAVFEARFYTVVWMWRDETKRNTSFP